MNIVITMAGSGSRFKKAGYAQPKYMIKVKGRTLFEWSMESLSAFKYNYHFFIIRTVDGTKAYIENMCKKMDIKKYVVIEINEMTTGQAETAMLASKYWQESAPLYIYNIDTYVEREELLMEKIKGDGFIPCFEALGDHWSFVKLDDNEKVVEVREKKRISNNCSIGAYYFRSCRLYIELYNKLYNGDWNVEKGERYIAPMYNTLIEAGGEVYIQNIPSYKVHCLGTPEELADFARS